jgi:phospholipid/cholesterol/gamma-HCH transport system substrate-binding protein
VSRSLVPRMVALLVVIVVGVWYIAFDVLQYHVAAHDATVTVEMPSAGGLYVGAGVTYRGVQVGTVSALDLGQRDVAVRVTIDGGRQIPDNGPVYVKELSALGENYLDFQPASAAGPDLVDGSVVPAARVVLPTPLGTTLVDLGAMLRSVAPSDVQTVESFLTSAFVGTGPGLRNIVVTGQRLFQALLAAQPQTVNLVLDGRTDLETLEATDGDLATFTKGLASLTSTLASSDSDLRSLIANSAAAAQEIDPFLSANSADITALVRALATDAGVTNQYAPQVRAIFELLPYVSDDLGAVASGGTVHGVLEFNTADTVCPYIPGVDMPGPTQKVSSAALDNGCSASAADMLQRGASSDPAYAGGG